MYIYEKQKIYAPECYHNFVKFCEKFMRSHKFKNFHMHTYGYCLIVDFKDPNM